MSDFQTADLGQASYLVALGYALQELGGDRSGKRIFVFDASAEQEALRYFANAVVPCRNFYNALRDLKALIRSQIPWTTP